MRVERIAAWSNVMALIPAGYCAYGTWVLLHPSRPVPYSAGASDMSLRAVLVSLFAAVALVIAASVLNFVSAGRKRKNDLPEGESQPANKPHRILEQSQVLGMLPIYRQDLRVELLDFHKGTTLDFTKTTLFAKFSITCDDDTGITEMSIVCQHGESIYRGKPLGGLSGWIIKTPFHNPQYPYKSFEEQPLDTLSLWRELQTSGLKSGLMKTGWIGFVIPKRPVSGNQITSFGVDISRPQYKQPYRFRFRELTEQEDVNIFDRAFRED